MNAYKYVFLVLFLWCIVYTISFAFNCIKNGRIFETINAFLCIAASIWLCAAYIL